MDGTRRIRFLTPCAGGSGAVIWTARIGDVRDVEIGEAYLLMEAGCAVPVDEYVKRPTRKRGGQKAEVAIVEPRETRRAR